MRKIQGVKKVLFTKLYFHLVCVPVLLSIKTTFIGAFHEGDFAEIAAVGFSIIFI